jgi:hypothetical protein
VTKSCDHFTDSVVVSGLGEVISGPGAVVSGPSAVASGLGIQLLLIPCCCFWFLCSCFWASVVVFWPRHSSFRPIVVVSSPGAVGCGSVIYVYWFPKYMVVAGPVILPISIPIHCTGFVLFYDLLLFYFLVYSIVFGPNTGVSVPVIVH